MRRRLSLLLALALCVPLTVSAVWSAALDDFSDLSARLEVAGQKLASAQAEDGTKVDLAEPIEAFARALADLRGAVLDAAAREADLRREIYQEAEAVSALVATLQRLSLETEGQISLHPGGPVAALRAEQMMQRIVPELQNDADALRARLETIAAAEIAQEDGLALLEDGLVQLADAREALALRVSEPVTSLDAADAEMAEILREAESLTDLTKALGDVFLDGAAGASDATAWGGSAWPVVGAALATASQPGRIPRAWRGVVLSAPPLSLVRAPADGTVRYAGPFLDFQRIVVLETDGAALVTLANLADIVVAAGETVRAGDPIGMLGGRSPRVEEYVKLPDLESGAGLRVALYVEIRDGGGPIDPVSWFEGKNG
ncbi:MAG: peptidoglycan DD-metalloendopeptidase family protein [Pseudomonadota bacterium]